ncbi:Transposase IS605, OrfB, C-terminal [Acididesulfobacillus acetoxydans]|uniref:Transposase IS605, OrfB, C-terminal n=1 Tax=Acididesulfobacillus acetoxydans TaxID=1561005 RepID=A0A8S0VYX8_9FIRM|nr:transposase [Acididesulfobacillus acetoxydans]CAA7603453.1 Transposase IS605, OrfB, C-terminal [Acididesulfobacillus acetoxydans]CEJ07677.1 Transposase, IS605 OrfB [Acididesulfobacillus acetoxydans]
MAETTKQVITIKLKLYAPTKAKQDMYQTLANRTTDFANRYLGVEKPMRPKTSADAKPYSEPLPSVVLCQAIRDIEAKKKAKEFKRLWPGFNNQNFRVEKETMQDGGAAWKVSFPTLEKRVGVPIQVEKYQVKYLELLLAGGAKQGTAQLVKCGKQWYTHLSITVWLDKDEREKKPAKYMGIDLGLIELAVASILGCTLFFSGAELAYIRRHYAKLRRKLQKKGAHRALKKLGNKEYRWITAMNHRISHRIVEFAKVHGVTVIRMEDLRGTRWTKSQRKERRRDAGRSLHSWAFFQLREFVGYKAKLAGIAMELVNPELTSLTCSRCGEVRTSRPAGRWYTCPRCGKIKHIDTNAADNIAQAISGLSEEKQVRLTQKKRKKQAA